MAGSSECLELSNMTRVSSSRYEDCLRLNQVIDSSALTPQTVSICVLIVSIPNFETERVEQQHWLLWLNKSILQLFIVTFHFNHFIQMTNTQKNGGEQLQVYFGPIFNPLRKCRLFFNPKCRSTDGSLSSICVKFRFLVYRPSTQPSTFFRVFITTAFRSRIFHFSPSNVPFVDNAFSLNPPKMTSQFHRLLLFSSLVEMAAIPSKYGCQLTRPEVVHSFALFCPKGVLPHRRWYMLHAWSAPCKPDGSRLMRTSIKLITYWSCE